jgi:hypothetical protein
MSTPHRRIIDARLQLLDRQILDDDGNPIGTVDDIELDDLALDHDIAAGTAAPQVTALVSGHGLSTRILGGRPPDSRLQFIPWNLVGRIGVVISLRPTDHQFDTLWVERWLRRHVIGRIPGGRHAPQ